MDIQGEITPAALPFFYYGIKPDQSGRSIFCLDTVWLEHVEQILPQQDADIHVGKLLLVELPFDWLPAEHRICQCT